MRAPRFNPLALPSVLLLAVALLVPWIVFRLPWIADAGLAVLALASPFAILLAGHLLFGAAWRRNLILAFTSLPLWFGWSLAVTAVAWMKMGLRGAVVFGGALSVVAVVGVLAALPFRDRASAPH